MTALARTTAATAEVAIADNFLVEGPPPTVSGVAFGDLRAVVQAAVLLLLGGGGGAGFYAYLLPHLLFI